MFDPERDEDRGSRPFLLRLIVVAAITITGCLALWPSVHGFAAGPDHLTGCLAITDGWHAQKSGPDLTKIAFPPPPTPEVRNDPAALARWRAEWQAAQARPEVQQAIAFVDWQDGPGACVRESRHRLLVSGLGLGAIVLVVAGTSLIVRYRTRKDLRPSPAVAGVG